MQCKIVVTWPQWSQVHCGICELCCRLHVWSCIQSSVLYTAREHIVSNIIAHFPSHLHASERAATMIYAHCQAFSAKLCVFSILMISVCASLPDAARDYTGLSLLISLDRGYNSSIPEMLQLWSEQPCRTFRPNRQKLCCQAFWI